jgi:hypothetical protein
MNTLWQDIRFAVRMMTDEVSLRDLGLHLCEGNVARVSGRIARPFEDRVRCSRKPFGPPRSRRADLNKLKSLIDRSLHIKRHTSAQTA